MMSAQFQAAPECVVNLSIPSIIIVISNNSWCRLWSVVMLMGHISVGVVDDHHSGGQFCPIRCHSTAVILCIAAYISRLLLTPDTADQQAAASPLGTQRDTQYLFHVFTFSETKLNNFLDFQIALHDSTECRSWFRIPSSSVTPCKSSVGGGGPRCALQRGDQFVPHRSA